MKTIKFTPGGFIPGNTYYAELVFNGAVVDTINNLVNNVPQEFIISTPGNYILRVMSQQDNECIWSQNVQAFFPLVTHSVSDVDCNNNTYTINVTLTNPTTAGTNVQYGWSLLNECSKVTNWSNTSSFIVPADDVLRYFYVKNNNLSCCTQITSSSKSPCVTCDLTVTNISFTCG